MNRTIDRNIRRSFTHIYSANFQRRIGSIRCVLFILIVIALSGAPRIARASDGDLDLSFGSGGKVVIQNVANLSDEARAVAVQPDGKILVGGQTMVALPGGQAILLRLNRDGSLDPAFGNGGRVVSNTQLHIGGIVIQPDGKILTAGAIAGPGPSISFAVSRYNPDGSIDTSFGNGGYATLGPQSEPVTVSDSQALLLQPDGRIVAAGYAQLYPSGKGFMVARFNADGSRDQSFGSGGSVFTLFMNGDTEAQAVALQTDGMIVASGYITSGGPGRNFALARYSASGSIDLNFGIEGTVTTNFALRNYAMASGIVIQPDGKIIAVGGFTQQNDGFLVARYNNDGRLDQSYGSGGKVMTSFGAGFGRGHANAALLQPDGKLLIAGSTTFGNVSWETDVVTARYNTNGTFDQTFGNKGIVVSNFSVGIEEGEALAFQPDGKLVAAGYSSEPSASYTDFAVARYLLAPRRTQFDFDGDAKADISVYRSGTWYLNRSTMGFFGFQFGLSTDRVVPADYDGDGKTDIAVFRPGEGNWYCFNSSNSTYSAYHFGSNGDIPAVGDYDGDGRADYAVFRGGAWYLQRSTAGFAGVQFGLSTDRPVAADYDGDGKTDIAVYRDGVWYIDRSLQGLGVIQFGLSGDRAVAADYDGDGKADVAVWRPAEGTWYIYQSSTATVRGTALGLPDDIPAPGDYDGDGKADLAVYRNSGDWWIWQSGSNGYMSQNFGLAGDVPVPSACVH